MHNDDEYEIDAKGCRVLIGLTTEELSRFDALLSTPSNLGSFGDPETPEETRWVELLDKHDTAMMPWRHMRMVKH